MTSLYIGTTNRSGLAAAVAFLYIYIFVYGIFLDGPGYYYVSCAFNMLEFALILFQANEVFPTHLRSKGATLCVSSYALINIMWTQVSPIAFKIIGWKYYLLFISCCVVAAAVMYFTFPDTLNKPLEEVALMFGDEDLVSHYIKAQGNVKGYEKSSSEGKTEKEEIHLGSIKT